MEVLYPRCAGGCARRQRHCVRSNRAGRAGHVRPLHRVDDDSGFARVVRVAHGARLYSRRDGSDGRVLEES